MDSVFPDLSSGAVNSSVYSASNSVPYAFYTYKINSDSVFFLWHARLGHPSSKIVQHVMRLCNIPFDINKTDTVCKSCCYGKSHKLSFSPSSSIYLEPLQLIYIDIWGLAPV